MQRNFCRSLQIESIALVKVSYVFCKQSYLMQVISLIVKADHKSFNETVKSVLDTEISKITKEDDLIKYNESYLQMHSFSLKAHIAGNQYFQTLTFICFFFFVFFVLPSLNAVFYLHDARSLLLHSGSNINFPRSQYCSSVRLLPFVSKFNNTQMPK